jgi:2-iminobutanoate/2-iminopropanoate deaminase
MRKTVSTTHAPKPIGPFSQAIVCSGMIFVSAQLAYNTSSGEFIMENIEVETAQVMDNIKAILKEAGVGLSHVVKSSIFLKDMLDYEKVNSVYSSYFTEPFPARETIQVGALPKNVNIEISVIALRG